mgnify:CR=1 FL=1
MSRNDEIEDLDFQDICLALDRHIGYKIYSIQNQRHQCHHRARRSLLQQHLACFLLSGSPGQAPILHCPVHGCQQGQAHIISLVKILAPDANHIIIPYSCARHKARTSKKQQQIKFSKPEHWFFTQSAFRDIIALVTISASICKS